MKQTAKKHLITVFEGGSSSSNSGSSRVKWSGMIVASEAGIECDRNTGHTQNSSHF